MSTTPKSDDASSLNDSWEDITENNIGTYLQSDTPVHFLMKNVNNGPNNSGRKQVASTQSLEKILVDIQKESGGNCSSLKGSLLCSLPLSPDGLHTPPNSVHFNNEQFNDRLNTDWLWDWSNRYSSKEWNTHMASQNKKSKPSLRQWVVRRGILSKEVLSLLFLTNVLSLILGAGIGYTIIIRKAF